MTGKIDIANNMSLSRRSFLGASALSTLAAVSAFPRDSLGASATAFDGGKVTEAERLAKFAADISFEKLPPSLIVAVKRLMLDTLGCAIGALGCEPARLAQTAAANGAANDRGATILGTGRRSDAAAATFVNGTLVRYLDFLDVYWTKDVCHPSENIPPAIACVEEAGGSGRDLIEAIVVGYEAQSRLCDVFAFPSVGLHHGSAAGFVVPLVAGKAWRQTATQMAHGIALGGSRHLTLNVMLDGDLSMAKALAYSLNAAEAITAARLAGAGFTGPLGSLDWLFAKMPQQRTDKVSLDLEPGNWRTERVSLKRYPVQYALQAPVEAAVNLRSALGDKRGEIAKIMVTMRPSQLARIADPAKFRPANRETADHSLPACVAIALADGKLTEYQFANNRFGDPDVLALIAKLKAVGSDDLEQRFPRGRPARLEVELSNGERHHAEVEVPLGDATRPFDDQTVHDKFYDLAGPVLGAPGARAAAALVGRLETLTTLDPLMSMLRRTT